MNYQNDFKNNINNYNKLLFPHSPFSDNFLRTITSIFRVARWFGVGGRSSKLVMAWGACVFLSLLLIEGVAFYRVMKAIAGYAVDTTGQRSVTARLSGAIFYGNALFSLTLTWRFSYNWPKLATHWAAAERMSGLIPEPDITIRRNIFIVTTICACCGVVEHVLSMISAVGLDFPLSEFLQRYILTSHGFLMFKREYSLFLGIFLFIMSKFATLMWNFQDLVIILMSMGLSARYARLNHQVQCLTRVNADAGKDKKINANLWLSWRKAREGYVRQAALVRRVNNEIGGMILLSNFNNMYFICLQLFLGITEGIETNLINFFYYILSFTWLLFRAASVVLAASNVNMNSRAALPFIYHFPTNLYTVEVERLREQLSKDFVALGGKGFYYLERNLLLKVAGAIATYELVLIQFDSHH